MKPVLSAVCFAGAVLTAACAGVTPTVNAGGDAGAFNGATIDVAAEGGIAAFAVTQRVVHDTRAFSFVRRRICGAACGAPLDSAAGTLTPAQSDSLFDDVLEAARGVTKSDYGITRNGADMMVYTIRIAADGRTQTIRGDDGTLPDLARQIVENVRQAIAAARAR